MSDLKPLGSEKLNADNKLKRILELTYYGNDKKSSTTNSSSTMRTEHISESVNGFKYGIVKEKDGYYVKKGLNESSLDYIGGLFMKNKNRFNSYAEALKRLELLNGNEINEATKYVLKQKLSPESNSDNDSAPVDVPSEDMSNEMGSEDMGGDVPPTDNPPSDMGGDMPQSSENKPSDYMAEIQKFAGKLGQELRDQKEKMESDDIKYVLNMIISAVDLEKLDDEDIDDIGKKFNRDVEDDSKMSDEMSDVPADNDTTPSEPNVGEDLGEINAMDKLESFINTPISTDEEIDLRKYSDLGGDVNETKEIDLDEIKNEINKSISQTLGKYFK